MRIHFVTFATPAFRGRQVLLNCSARLFGHVDQLHVWSQARLEKDGFMDRHPELFPDSKGFGWYAWKPYIILQALQAAEEGDLVIYQDVGRRDPVVVSRSLREWDRYLIEKDLPCIAGVSIPSWGANKLWTKKETLEGMGLTASKYLDAPQVQASWSIWRKMPSTESFVREWAEKCQQLPLVGGNLVNGIEGEVAGFQEHRWDQSILTLLALRDSLPVLHPEQMRVQALNEKSLDSFTPGRAARFGYLLYKPVVSCYHWTECLLKRFSTVVQ